MDEAPVTCPYCWEEISLTVDTSVDDQSYVEDCPVCCHPMNVRVIADDGELVDVQVERADA